MQIIILSGGSGKRLWPLSNDIRSKQFIKFFKNEKDEYQSMIQKIYSQILAVDSNAEITIATAKSQVSAINNQLGENVNICVEPYRRDTFPAIVLASAYLHDVKNISEDEIVVVCPVDPYVENTYFESLKKLAEIAENKEYNLSLMGIEPSYPSEKYGYIIPKDSGEISEVLTFKEKPDLETAKEYLKKGALWNGGVFAYRLKYILDKAHQKINFSDYYDLYEKYEEIEKISFDYEVVEKEAKIQVMRYKGEWKDVGTWNTLTESLNEECIGKAILNEKCNNVHVINELNIPILCMGLKDVVVSASPDGILVSDKEQSSYIKPYVDDITNQVMFAEKTWGSFRVIDVENGSMTIKVTLNKGHKMNYHSHKKRDEIWSIISGEGRTIVDGMWQKVKAGDVITIEAGCKHTIIADTELKLIEVQLGKEINVNDKQKYKFPE